MTDTRPSTGHRSSPRSTAPVSLTFRLDPTWRTTVETKLRDYQGLYEAEDRRKAEARNLGMSPADVRRDMWHNFDTQYRIAIGRDLLDGKEIDPDQMRARLQREAGDGFNELYFQGALGIMKSYAENGGADNFSPRG